MGLNLDWHIEAHHTNGNALTRDEAQEICKKLAVDPFICALCVAEFSTTSFSSPDFVWQVTKEITKENPSIILEIFYKRDTSECPSKVIVKKGKASLYAGRVEYSYVSSL